MKKLYPERQRCLTCRKKLEDIVLDGMYCSYQCLGIKSPSQNVEKAPRHCRREVSGKWDFKSKYKSPNSVPLKLQNDPATNIYSCDYCHFFHVGHSRPTEFTTEKLRRTVQNSKTTGSVIQRARESKNIPLKVLAKRLKVAEIRLQEVENGNPNMHVEVMFAMMYALHLQIIIQEK